MTPVRLRRARGRGVLAMIAAAAVSPTAGADVGFLLPNTFHTDESGRVTVIASFSDQFPDVEHALRSDDFHIMTATGARRPFTAVHELEQMTALFAELDAPGVYRLSSGERLGRKGEATRLDGAYVRLGEDGMDVAALPAGAPILTSQTATVSEVYVRRGDVDPPMSLATSGRLSISLSAGRQGFRAAAPVRVAVTFDGTPLAGAALTVIAPFAAGADQTGGATLILDENGAGVIAADRPGPHVVLVRHIAEAPADAQTDLRSYSTALVFEIE